MENTDTTTFEALLAVERVAWQENAEPVRAFVHELGVRFTSDKDGHPGGVTDSVSTLIDEMDGEQFDAFFTSVKIGFLVGPGGSGSYVTEAQMAALNIHDPAKREQLKEMLSGDDAKEGIEETFTDYVIDNQASQFVQADGDNTAIIDLLENEGFFGV